MSGVAPMDAAAKTAPAPQQVVGQPVATPRAGDTYNYSCTFNYNYAASAASDSASRGASPLRPATDMPVCAAPTAARTTISASYPAPPERLDTARAKPRSVHVAGLRFS